MRPDFVVVPAPSFDDHLCFEERVKDLSAEQLVAHLSVERLAVTVNPWT